MLLSLIYLGVFVWLSLGILLRPRILQTRLFQRLFNKFRLHPPLHVKGCNDDPRLLRVFDLRLIDRESVLVDSRRRGEPNIRNCSEYIPLSCRIDAA